jgi:hypothetical protein
MSQLVFQAGIAITLLGWAWMLVIAQRLSMGWFFAMLFLFPIAAPCLAFQHWGIARLPFIITIIGAVVLYLTVQAVLGQTGRI